MKQFSNINTINSLIKYKQSSVTALYQLGYLALIKSIKTVSLHMSIHKAYYIV